MDETRNLFFSWLIEDVRCNHVKELLLLLKERFQNGFLHRFLFIYPPSEDPPHMWFDPHRSDPLMKDPPTK